MPFEPFTTDNYFERYDKPTVFVVNEQEIVVAGKRLANALCSLSEQRRTVLLMYFFLRYTDEKIGREYGRSRSTVNYWKLAALRQLRKIQLYKAIYQTDSVDGDVFYLRNVECMA